MEYQTLSVIPSDQSDKHYQNGTSDYDPDVLESLNKY